MAAESTGQTTRGAEMPAGKELSAVLGRILDQLSLSAWMPGIVVTGGVAFLVALGESNPHHELPSIGSAASALATPSIGGALVLALAVVFSTVMTQAFEFEMIKLLEGYWSDRWVSRRFRRRRVARLQRKGAELKKLVRRRERKALRASLTRLAGGDKELKRRLRSRLDQKHTEAAPEDPEVDFLLSHWRTAADPVDLRRLESLERSAQNYPAPHRTMPTLLGNTLRAHEDRMQLADGGDLEGFILRNYDRIPERLLAQVSDFRTRLNMYCSLVLAWALLALTGVAATWRYAGYWHLATVGTAAACVTLALASYLAAISSARGYGAALLAADKHVANTKESGGSTSAES